MQPKSFAPSQIALGLTIQTMIENLVDVDEEIVLSYRRRLLKAEIRGVEPAGLNTSLAFVACLWPKHSIALELIKHGVDPFEPCDECGTTAFHAVANGGNIDMLLAMVAEPGTGWTERFFFSKNKVIKAPVRGRGCIASKEDFVGDGVVGLSMEGLEVMMMYGYKPTEIDLTGICVLAVRDAKYLRMVVFCLGMTNLASDIPLLTCCLGVAIGANHSFFDGEKQTTSLELAKLLLNAGADPNGYCMNDEDSFTPALIQALENGDSEMVKLLIEYGAEIAQPARVKRIFESRVEIISPETKAKEMDMEEILQLPLPRIQTNPRACLRGLRRGLMAPLKRELVSNLTPALVVAAMRSTGCVPPLGLLSKTVLDFCYCPVGLQEH